MPISPTGKHQVTDAGVKVAKIMPKAMAEGWGSARVAEECGIGHSTAKRYIERHRSFVIQSMKQESVSVVSVLASEAQKARDFALGHMQSLRELVHSAAEHVKAMAPKNGKAGHPQKLDKFGEPLPFCAKSFAQASGLVVKTSKDLMSYAEQVTGLDVAKQIAIKSATAKDGPMHSWDGVESLTNCIEADIIKDVQAITESEPEPVPLWPEPLQKKSVRLW